MQRRDVRQRLWDPAQLETADCFRCALPGRARYDLDGFGVRVCSRCGLWLTSPRPNEVGRKALYDDDAYFDGGIYSTDGRVGATTALQGAWARGRLKLIATHLDAGLAVGAGQRRLLEVGCAYGLFLAAARARGFEVTGLEYSAPAAQRVRDHHGVTVHDGHLEDVDLTAAFDVVCAWDVVEHVPDPHGFLTAAARLTHPGGIVALSCPYTTSWPARLLRSRWRALKPWEHLWHFSPATLRATADDVGLRLVDLIASPRRAANLTRLDSMVAVLRRP